MNLWEGAREVRHDSIESTLNKVNGLRRSLSWSPENCKSATRDVAFVVRVTATALIVQEGRILLGKRTSKVRFAGMWDAFGGRLERGETPELALRREVREELAIEVTMAQFLHVYEDVDPTSGETFRHHLFLVTGWDGEPGIANEEHSEIRWFRPEEVSDLALMPHLREAIAMHVPGNV
jgi:mutator protein MutT